MAEITASKDPGYYATAQTVTVTFPANARKAIITTSDRPPVLTEILAYDKGPITPVPPDPANAGPVVERPFLAVTQDGKGNVVYDGGFPKFYNMRMATGYDENTGWIWPATPPTTREGLTPAGQYFLNELSFIASKKKVGLGNRKVLFVNNTVRNEIYNIYASHYKPDPATPPGYNFTGFGFRDTFDAVCNVGGWVPTYYDCTDAGGNPIDLDIGYLDQYVAVVFVSSYGGGSKDETRVTDRFINDLAQLRRFGSGVAIITDHMNANFTSVSDALENGVGFGYDATRVAQYYNAYFSGNVDREAVSVGYIREQIGGDHPLFAGMSDSELIPASESESIIYPDLSTADEVPPNQPYSVTYNTPGTYRINVLVQMEDGTIITRNLRYVIISPSDISMVDYFDRALPESGTTTYKRAVDCSLQVQDLTGTLYGKIFIDDTLVGWFLTKQLNGTWDTTYAPLAGEGVPIIIQNGQRLRFITQDPFEYEVSAMLNIPDPLPYWDASFSQSTFLTKLTTHPYYSGISSDNIVKDLTTFTDKVYPASKTLGGWIKGQWWKIIGKGRPAFSAVQVYDPIRLKIYINQSAWETAKPDVGVVGDAIIVANTNAVYYWDDALVTWVLHNSSAQNIFETGRKAINLIDNTDWIVQDGTTVPV